MYIPQVEPHPGLQLSPSARRQCPLTAPVFAVRPRSGIARLAAGVYVAFDSVAVLDTTDGDWHVLFVK